MVAPVTRYTGRRGATLIEAVAAMLVLSIAIPPLVALFREVAAHEPQRIQRAVGVLYAESLMEEIASKAFEDPDMSSGSFGTEEPQRRRYDDIDDFDGLNNSPPERLDGTVLADYADFKRSATVVNVLSADPDAATPEADGSTNLKRISVTVAWPDGEFTLATLRALSNSAGGALDQAASSASVTDDNKKKIKIALVNTSDRDLVIASFSLSADVPTEPLHRLKLQKREIYHEHDGKPLPTGTVSISDVAVKDRTIAANTSPTLEIRLDSNPTGTVNYTLILAFVDGTSSVLSFTVDW